MSWVDIVIAIAVIVATERGLRVGILRQVGSLVGFVTGFVIGILVAPWLAGHIHGGTTRPLVAALIVTTFVVLGSIAGRQVGSLANLSLRRLNLGTVDKVGGAAFAALGTLIACWLVASLLVNVSFVSLSSAIASSRLLAVMDTVMPPVPSVEAKVQAMFRSANFPSVFASVIAPTVPTVSVPNARATTAAIGTTANSVFKVSALDACGFDLEGTAFLVSPDLVVTAAHVVAGARTITVNGAATTLVAFDANNDVAVLKVAHSTATPIVLWSSTPPTGSPAGVVGYPNNGPRTETRAAIAGVLVAQGRDIYNNALVTRHLLVADTNVFPGNSGSPLLVGGRAAGLIFSKSVAQANVAYAVPAGVLRRDISRAAATTTSVSSGACLSE